MPAPPWQGVKIKVYLRLATQRLHTLIAKKENLAKTARRDIATLIERSKIEIARIRVEAMIQDDLHIELLETLELYTELLRTRFPLLENSINSKGHTLDPRVKEAVISIVYGADNTEVTELKFVRESIANIMGRDWVIGVMENRDNCVSPRVVGKVVTETPSPTLVDAYLEEIARGYGLSWTSTREAQEPRRPLYPLQRI
ncbi:hypothetical protein BS47DRAFT_711329 [Hydnum rufescens UP504]|uniref:IST1-like protein n=1 Tax=Hydnum rufescens UP504 TaxID=1448309 RepID=A0A9P6B1N6_9AGAM|nr:hypothetical protein BS47DRAFT_711329 [Hydnum rufescens UP504]